MLLNQITELFGVRTILPNSYCKPGLMLYSAQTRNLPFTPLRLRKLDYLIHNKLKLGKYYSYWPEDGPSTIAIYPVNVLKIAVLPGEHHFSMFLFNSEIPSIKIMIYPNYNTNSVNLNGVFRTYEECMDYCIKQNKDNGPISGWLLNSTFSLSILNNMITMLQLYRRL